MTDLQAQIDELKARLDTRERQLEELLSIPHVNQMIDQHRNYLLSMEAARVAEEEARRQREAQEAELRRRVERDPLLRITVAPNVFGANGLPLRYVSTHRGFELARSGSLFHGGIMLSGGEPMATEHTPRTSEWRAQLERDDDLRVHFEAGHLSVEAFPVERVLSDKRLARHYQ